MLLGQNTVVPARNTQEGEKRVTAKLGLEQRNKKSLDSFSSSWLIRRATVGCLCSLKEQQTVQTENLEGVT